MNRRNVVGAIGAMVVGVGAGASAAEEGGSKSIAERLQGRRVRIYPQDLTTFILGTVDRVEGTLIYLKDVKFPITEHPRDALIDASAVRLITVLETDAK